MATSGRVPRTAGLQRISLFGRPLAKQTHGRFNFGFAKKEVEFARGGAGIHLLVPSPPLALKKPLDDVPVFLRGQAVDSSLDLLNPAPVWSLSPTGMAFIQCQESA
jgi:hypothetical protein